MTLEFKLQSEISNSEIFLLIVLKGEGSGCENSYWNFKILVLVLRPLQDFHHQDNNQIS